MNIKKNYKPVAVSIFSAGWCNLKCDYCYIPKQDDKHLKNIHNSLINDIENNPQIIIDRINKYFDKENLEIISHWGTEPTLTFYKFIDFYKLAFQEYPNLKKISFSSNFMTDVNKTVNAMKQIQELKSDIEWDIQLSLDGPYWITEQNRGKNTTSNIIKNILSFYILTKELDIKNISTHFKPTISQNNLREYTKEKIIDYYRFFDNLIKQMIDINDNINTLKAYGFTIVTTPIYTVEDGKKLNQIFQWIESLNKDEFPNSIIEFSYYNSFKRLMKYRDEFYSKPKMFTCSAGDSQFGITQKGLHPCHDTYYWNIEGHNKVLNISQKELSSISNALIYEDEDYYRHLLFDRSFHDYTKLRVGIGVGQLLTLVNAGQVSDVFKDTELSKLFSEWVNSRLNCYVNTYYRYKTTLTSSFSYYKLFGNGVFENMVKKYMNEEIN